MEIYDYTDEDTVGDVIVSSGGSPSMASRKNNRDELFIKELNKLPFSDEIKSEAFNIYKNMGSPIKRKNNREAMKLFCVYHAHLNLDRTIDINKIATTFQLGGITINQMFKMFSYKRTGFRPKEGNTSISPSDYIPVYYKYTGYHSKHVSDIIMLSDKILSTGEIEDEYPQAVAIAIIVYYLHTLNGVLLDEKFYAEVQKYNSTVKKILPKIGVLDNS